MKNRSRLGKPSLREGVEMNWADLGDSLGFT